MTNHMAEVAKILGVELGEVFRIVIVYENGDEYKYRNYYRLTEKGGIEVSDDNITWDIDIAGVLMWLLLGNTRIVKLPWKPQEDERYYTPFIATNPRNMYDEFYWENDDVDIERYRMGLVCKTSVEAVELAKKMLAVINEQ